MINISNETILMGVYLMSDDKKSNKRGTIIMILNIVVMICNYVISILTPQTKEIAMSVVSGLGLC